MHRCSICDFCSGAQGDFFPETLTRGNKVIFNPKRGEFVCLLCEETIQDTLSELIPEPVSLSPDEDY